MCGIVGMWNFDGKKLNSVELDQFTDSLRHRGPDGRGTYIDKKASLGLGHRRLSILDLTDSGHQPMSYGDGKYWITYNGEIYNYLDFGDYKTDGHVLIDLYKEHGIEFTKLLDGEFAICLIDFKNNLKTKITKANEDLKKFEFKFRV